jgi:hypothetical protein
MLSWRTNPPTKPMTIAGDAEEMEDGFDTGTADSDNAVAAVRIIIASNANQHRDVDGPFN